VAISLSASLFVAIFLVPVLASTYLPISTRQQKPLSNPLLKKLDAFFEGFFEGLDRFYRWLLSAVLCHRAATIILVIAALIGAVLAIPRMGIVFIPRMDEDSVSLNVTMRQGTRYEDTRDLMLQLQEFAMNEINGARNIIATVGNGNSGSNQGVLTVQLDMSSDADTSQEVMDKLRAHFGDFPGVEMRFGAGRTASLLSGNATDIDLVLRFDDIDTGLGTAREIAGLLERDAPELTDIAISMQEGLPQVEVVIDRNRAYDLGLSVSSIASELSAAMNGVTATTFRSTGSEYSVVLELQKEDREKIPDLERIFAAASSGALIPLSNFASLEKGLGPVTVNHEGQSRIIHITASLSGGGSASHPVNRTENRIRELLDETIVLSEGMSLSYEGSWETTSETIKTFGLIFSLAVLLVFGVMAGQYESFKDPIINFCTIPLLIIGVVLVYIFTGQNLSSFSLVGVVMLAGIVVNNGIVLVDYTNLLVRGGMAVREASLEAGVSRLRPVLMTTLTTVLGLIPMAFFPGKSSIMIQPIGLTVVGGLVSSTIITLLFIPVMYSLVNETKGSRKAVDKPVHRM
jgi:HAE1 family hydrophobic/amphiphilic exporter-1